MISAVTGLLFSIISMRTNQMNSQSQNAQQNSTNRMMMIMSPLMSLWIGFIMPAGLGVYWVVNNLLSLLQEFVAGKILKKDYEAAANRNAWRRKRRRKGAGRPRSGKPRRWLRPRPIRVRKRPPRWKRRRATPL